MSNDRFHDGVARDRFTFYLESGGVFDIICGGLTYDGSDLHIDKPLGAIPLFVQKGAIAAIVHHQRNFE